MNNLMMKAARRAPIAMRAGAIVASLCLFGFAAPLVNARLDVQQTNAYWQERAESFVKAFDLNPATASQDGFALDEGRDGHLWRLARAYDTAINLDAFQRDRDAIGVYQTFATAHFDQADRQARELQCLAQAIYYEARSESRPGQVAVAEVVLNRVRHRLYPNSICEVVFQGSELRTGCQFSFTCDGSMRREPRGRAWTNANEIAAHAMLGFGENPRTTGDATHYHTVAVNPVWSATLVRTGQVGSHIFYRFPGRAGRLPSADTPA